MNFHILTLFPEMVIQGLNTSIIGRACEKGLLSINAVNIRDFTTDKHKKVDDYPYGGGAGMLMQAQPVYDSFQAVKAKMKEGAVPRVIYVTPQGPTFHQQMAIDFLKAGLKGYETDKLVREYFDSQNYKGAFGHGLGHGVGLEIHEAPNASQKSEHILKENMTLTVEPGIYLPDKFGVRIEDMGAVTKTGFDNFTKSEKKLIVL